MIHPVRLLLRVIRAKIDVQLERCARPLFSLAYVFLCGGYNVSCHCFRLLFLLSSMQTGPALKSRQRETNWALRARLPRASEKELFCHPPARPFSSCRPECDDDKSQKPIALFHSINQTTEPRPYR